MVKDIRLVPMIEELEQAVQACTADARDSVHKRVRTLIDTLQEDGQPVPQRLHDLDEMLTDAEVEDQFDNLPV